MGIFQEKEQSGQKIPQVTRFYTNTIIGNSFFLKRLYLKSMYIYFVIERKYQHLDIMLLMKKDSAVIFFLILKHISELQML